MTNADMIREMNDDQLVELLVWRNYGIYGFLPDCEDDCEDFRGGCANDCSIEKRERAMRRWLEAEAE